jgi:putative chitinase
MTCNAIDIIIRIAPHARADYMKAIRKGDALFDQHKITTPLRMAHFLAQALHETGGFTILRENLNYSASRLIEIFGVNHHSAGVTTVDAAELAGHPEAIAERVYGLGNPRKAMELGNALPGDGFLYRGNGILQTTGRGNHRRLGAACGLDLETAPDLAISPEHALKPALYEWTDNNLNSFADRNDIRTITLKINGGLTGLADRESWFEKIWQVLKSDNQLKEPWEASDKDENVEWLQEALDDLGADPRLIVDGRYGPATRQAVKDFQTSEGIPADGVAGPVTKAAIKLRLDTIRGGN